jgi:ATPase subunit of ABC transporter with duplicated ATPase domains
LAQALFVQHIIDLLFLDEVSNHLDLNSMLQVVMATLQNLLILLIIINNNKNIMTILPVE